MDVFDYFKRARQIRESTTSDRAHELGYEYQSRGVWLDPQTGDRYRAKGNRFEKVQEKEPSQRGAAKKDVPQQQKQTLGDFKKQATARQDLVPDKPSSGVDPEFDAENRAKASAGGMWPHLPEKNKQDAIAREKAAAMAAQEPEEEPIEEPAPEDAPEVDENQVELVAKALGGSRWERLDGPTKDKFRDQARETLAKKKEEPAQEPKERKPSPKQKEFDAALAKADVEEKPKPKTLSQFRKKTEKVSKKNIDSSIPSIAEKKEMEAEMNLDDLLDSIRKDDSNIKVDHKDPDSIFVPQPVPDGKLNAAAVSTSTPSPIPPQSGEDIEEYEKRADDGYGKNIVNQKLQVPKGERRADYIFGDSKKTDLIGESAYMEAALKIFDGSYDTDVLEMVGKKNLKPEDQKKVDSLLADIREAIPSKGLNKGWEESAARMVKLTTQHMDPNRKYKFGKSGDGMEGMRLTTVPQDMQDFSYDLANQTLVDKIGKEGMRKLLDNDTAGIMDHYDPTDVVFFAEDAIEPFLQQVKELGDQFDNSDSKTKEEDLLNGIRKLKQKFMEDRSLLPISLKKPKKGSDPHFIPRNVSGDYDEDTMKTVNFDLLSEGKDGMTWGFDGSRMGDLTDNFSMNFNMKDDVYSGNKFTMPVINHPGTGPHANDPFARVANIKSEPSLKGGAEAKLGILDTNWIGNEKVNEILGYNFEEKYGNRDDNLGIGSGKRKGSKVNVKFTDEDRQVMKNLVKEVAEHDGSAKVNMKLPKGMNAEQFVDSLIDADDLIHDQLEGKSIKKGKRGQDAMDINLDDDQKKIVKEKLGSIPDANFRSKIRTKFRQLRYAKLLQELEKSGKLADFGKEYIYKNTMKIGDEYSPFILLG